MLGKKIGRGNPVFFGLPQLIPVEALIALGASLNVSGNYDIYAVPGVTPLVRDEKDAFGNQAPLRTVRITQGDLDDLRAKEHPVSGQKISFCILGCPHYPYSQVERVGRLLTKPAAVPIYILTSVEVIEQADKNGLQAQIQRLGGKLIPHTCVDEVNCWHFLKGLLGVTDSPKAAYYMTSAGVTLTVQDVEQCIYEAILGKVCG